jgi:hypothetical protein
MTNTPTDTVDATHQTPLRSIAITATHTNHLLRAEGLEGWLRALCLCDRQPASPAISCPLRTSSERFAANRFARRGECR